jgi:amino acid efflux transporter
LTTLLTVAGQNFFLLYLLCALAYTRLFRAGQRVFGTVATIVLGIVAFTTFGPTQLAYAAVLTALGTAISATRAAGSKRRPT